MIFYVALNYYILGLQAKADATLLHQVYLNPVLYAENKFMRKNSLKLQQVVDLNP